MTEQLEQTLDYLKTSGQAQPQIEKRANELLARGYGQLVSFECIDPQTQQKKQGYEWFGQTTPPHEAPRSTSIASTTR